MNQWWQRESTKRGASKGSSGFTGWNTMAIRVHGMEKEIWLVLIWGQILLLETERDFIGGWGISYLDNSQSSGGGQDSSDIENGWTKLDCTDAQIMASQEKAPSTRYTTLRQDPRCSLCRDAPEIIQHITEGCKTLAGRAYSTWSIITK